MKYFIILFLTVSVSCNDTASNEEIGSPIILSTEAPLFCKVSVQAISLSEINGLVTFTNKSDSPFLFYKVLLPVDGKLDANLFSIQDVDGLENLNYVGELKGHYLKRAKDDDDGVIIPDPSPQNFEIINPGQTREFKVELSKYYNFSKKSNVKHFSISYRALIPGFFSNYKQIMMRDTTSNTDKPVYYWLLPENKILDSVKIYFTIPNVQRVVK